MSDSTEFIGVDGELVGTFGSSALDIDGGDDITPAPVGCSAIESGGVDVSPIAAEVSNLGWGDSTAAARTSAT
jgi:hypothetical protein